LAENVVIDAVVERKRVILLKKCRGVKPLLRSFSSLKKSAALRLRSNPPKEEGGGDLGVFGAQQDLL
jgi:hypothetical protein